MNAAEAAPELLVGHSGTVRLGLAEDIEDVDEEDRIAVDDPEAPARRLFIFENLLPNAVDSTVATAQRASVSDRAIGQRALRNDKSQRARS